MTIKPEVLAAMERCDYNLRRTLMYADLDAYETIRAELLAMDAEIERLKSAWDNQVRHSSNLSQIAQDAQQSLTQSESRLDLAYTLLRKSCYSLRRPGNEELEYEIAKYLSDARP